MYLYQSFIILTSIKKTAPKSYFTKILDAESFLNFFSKDFHIALIHPMPVLQKVLS